MNYSKIWQNIETLKELAASMDNAELVDEIHNLCYNGNGAIGDVLFSYWNSGDLSEDEREVLIWYFVLCEV